MDYQKVIENHIDECRHRVDVIRNHMNTNGDADTDKCLENIQVLETVISAMQELQLHKDTGLTSDQLREIDKMYSEQAKELCEYKKLGTFEELKILKETHLTGNELVQIYCRLKQLEEYENLGYLEDVRQAVDKQKIKKPYISEVDSDLFDCDTHRETVDVYKCPACDSFLSVVNEEEYIKHCPKCGQKLDWSDEK